MRRWLVLPMIVGMSLTDAVGSHGPVTAACGVAGAATATVYLPNITKTLGGPAGWVTPFIVQNVGVTPTTLEISFYRFTDGGLVACRVVEGLRPGNSFAHVPNEDPELPDDAQFAVVVRSFGASVISVVNEHQGAGARAEALSYRGVSVGATAVSLPYVAKAVSGWLTTIVIQNVGTGPAAVTARFSGAAGQTTLTRTVGVGRSAFIDPSVEPGLASGAEYAATITSDQPIAAVVNAHNDAPGTPAPMGFSYNGIPSSAGLLAYAPAVERGATSIDRTSRVLVQNAGDADATPTLTLRGSSMTTTVAAPAAVAPGRTWSFDPRFEVDGATPCPAAGAAGCMPQGQAGLVVSGGRFAVLVVGSTATSVLATTAGSVPARRSYLPNVTRTLGGSTGWSTPILVQSAGATAASLRWYRFADGVLVQVQQLSGLTMGATQRVDPRDVSGLVESTQYAVIAEGVDGDIIAEVAELSFQGGDGAMGYEGFPGAASALPPAAAAPITPRATSDRADDHGGPQVRVLYVLPSDAVDERLDTSGALALSVGAWNTWLAAQTDGRRLRLDTFAGALDVGFHRLGRTDADLRSRGAFVRDEIERELGAAGLLATSKLYAVYYGGGSTWACGGGAWPPTLPGQVAAMYLKGTPPGAAPCASNPLASREDTPGYMEFAMLHELLHTLGAVATCAPNHVLSGHSGDDPRDLMYAGPLAWRPSLLDVGRDDYYGHGRAGCFDLALSSFLAR